MIRSGKFDSVHRDCSDEVLHDCVAFSNTSGGFIHIGCDDGQVYGIPNADVVLSQIKAALQSQIFPRDLPSLVKISVDTVDGKDVIKIQVPAILTAIHYMVRGGLETGVYVRFETQTVPATAEQVAELLKRCNSVWAGTPYLARPSWRSRNTFDDLQRYCAEAGRASACGELLKADGPLVLSGGMPTNLGVLFGDQCPPQIQVYVQSPEAGKAVWKEYSGAYFDQIASARAYLESLSPLRREARYPLPYAYPFAAIDSLLYHAVRFRDYELPGEIIFYATADKISVTFPGTLEPPFSLDDYLNGGSYPRNPEISKALDALGSNIMSYADFGMITEIYAAYGLKPDYSISDHVMKISIPNLNRSPAVSDYPKLTAKERGVLDLIYLKYCVTRADIERELSLPQATAIRTLNSLVEKKYIEKTGAGKSTFYRASSSFSPNMGEQIK